MATAARESAVSATARASLASGKAVVLLARAVNVLTHNMRVRRLTFPAALQRCSEGSASPATKLFECRAESARTHAGNHSTRKQNKLSSMHKRNDDMLYKSTPSICS